MVGTEYNYSLYGPKGLYPLERRKLADRNQLNPDGGTQSVVNYYTGLIRRVDRLYGESADDFGESADDYINPVC